MREPTVFTVPADLREFDKDSTSDSGYLLVGKLQEAINSDGQQDIVLDFADCTWSDPTVLLLMLCTFASCQSRPNKSISIRFQVSALGESQRQFRRYLAAEYFLDEAVRLGVHIQFGRQRYAGDQARNVVTRFKNELVQYTEFSLPFIPYTLIRLTTNVDHSAIEQQIEEWIDAATKRSRRVPFMQQRRAKEGIIQKLRKALFELLLNVAEHATLGHATHVPVAIHARVRIPDPQNDFSPKTRNGTPRQFDFDPPLAPWLELYVADAGQGLLHVAESWSQPGDELRLADDLKKFRESGQQFGSIVHRLFSAPISRHRVREGSKTSVTGLMHLGHMLRHPTSNFVRVYAGGGQWAGGYLPLSSAQVQSPGKWESLKNERFPSGTVYSFSLRPESHVNFDEKFWHKGTETQLAYVAQAIEKYGVHETLVPGIVVEDQRDDLAASGPSEELLARVRTDDVHSIVYRPPRSFQKRDWSAWQTIFAGYPVGKRSPTILVDNLYIVDLSPIQALVLLELLLNIGLHRSATLNVFLVTEEWHVVALQATEKNRGARLEPDGKASRSFFGHRVAAAGKPGGPLTAATLALILREQDSRSFWRGIELAGSGSLLDEPVIWPTSDGRIFLLRSYLDVGVAMLSADVRRAARRSLRRLLYLFPGLLPVATDDLIRSLAEELALERAELPLGQSMSAGRESHVLVGSVGTSGQTLKRFREAFSGQVQNEIFLVNNEDSTPMYPKQGVDASKSRIRLTALRWQHRNAGLRPELESFPELARASKTEWTYVECMDHLRQSCEWERLSNTPFVARHGDRHVSVLRFPAFQEVPPAGPLAKKSPSQMYEELRIFDCLRFGHWHYTDRHELMTINVEQLYEMSKLQLGDLYQWLRESVRSLFPVGDELSVLLYPSHKVTDLIVADLLADETLQPHVTKQNVIPVVYAGQRSLSPNRVPPLTEERLHKLVARRKPWAAILFDSSCISGKTFSELGQLAKAYGASRISTLAVVDRSSQPYVDRLPEEYHQQNRRYMRFDVPPLGRRRECALCNALAAIRNYTNSGSRPSAKRLAGRYEVEWAVAQTSESWHLAGAKAIALPEPRKFKFGVRPDGNVLNTVTVADSTALASVLTELVRLTPRTDKILSFANKFAETDPHVSLQILATQLILFSDELDVHLRRQLLRKITQILFADPTQSHWTSLAVIAIANCDASTKRWLWGDYVNERLSEALIANSDAALAANILIDADAELGLSLAAEASRGAMSERRLKNFIALGRGSVIESALRQILGVLGSREKSWHGSLFRGILETFDKDNTTLSLVETKKYIADLERYLATLQASLNDLIPYGITLSTHAQEYLTLCADRSGSALQDLALVKFDIENSVDATSEGYAEGLGKVAANVLKDVYDSENCTLDVLKKLFISIPSNKHVSTVFQIFGIWPIATERLRQIHVASKNRGSASELMPQCGNTHNFPSEFQVYFDDYIRDLVVDTILNVVHADGDIGCPPEWSDSPGRARMWWNATLTQDFLSLQFCNGSFKNKLVIKSTPGHGRLEAVGGHVSVSSKLNERTEGSPPYLVFIDIHMPLISRFTN